MKDALAAEMAVVGAQGQIAVILAEVCRRTAMGFAALARVTDTRWIACQVDDRIGFGLVAGEELELKTTICDEIRQGSDAVFIDHVANNPEWRTHHTPVLYGFQSYVSLPIHLSDGSFFGTLCAIDPEPHVLNTEEIMAAMRGFADQLAALLSPRNCRLHASPGVIASPA